MTLVSEPTGATCTTPSGETYVLPASIPCRREGATSVQISLAGYTPRRVQLMAGKPRPTLASLLLVDLVGGLVGGGPDKVEVVQGKALVELQREENKVPDGR